MTTFLTTLRTLDAAATPGPWERRPQWIGDVGGPDDIPVAQTQETGNHPRGTPENHKERNDNAEIIAFLRNHAAAIIGCVEALERLGSCEALVFSRATDEEDRARIDLARTALAALETP